MNIEQIKSIKLNFILATARTGSTLLLSMLNMHPNVVVASEEPFVYNLYPKFGKIKKWTSKIIDRYCNDFFLLSLDRLEAQFGSKQDLKKSLEAYKSYLTFEVVIKLTYLCFQPNKDKSNITAIVDKQLEFHNCMEIIAKIYPDSKFIILHRDPRDQILAKVKLAKRMNESAKSSFIWAYTWRYKYKNLLKKASKINKERFLEIKYEDLILSPEGELNLISKFIGIPYDHNMLTYDEHFKKIGNEVDINNPVINKFLIQHSSLLQKVNKNKIGVWKDELTDKEANLIWTICGKLAEEIGYKKEEGFIKQKYKLKYGLDYFYFLIWNIMAPKIFHSLPYSIKYLIVSITKFDKKKPKAYHTN